VAAPASPVAAAGDAAPTLRVYFVGNSVTDCVRYENFQKLAASAGGTMVWGRHMIPGAPMFGLWESDHGFTQNPYGPSQKALSEFDWDVVTLQPFDRRFHNGEPDKPQGDLDIAQKYIDLAAKRNPGVRIYIYARWPRISKDGRGFKFDKDDYKNEEGAVDLTRLGGEIDDFTARYEAPFKAEGWDLTNEGRDYFAQLTLALRRQNPDMKNPVMIIPVGDVMNALHKAMKAGRVPGFTSVFGAYADGIHLNKVGSYVCGVTFYATIFRRDPRGLTGEPYGLTDAALIKTIQETAWEVIRRDPLAGVGDP
jgi:hypothetical protein